MPDVTPIRRALVSVYAKDGLEDLARGLARNGVAIVSTGSTAARIREAGVDVTEVADLTGFPECLDGRVKTLHPRIHAGLLADRDKPDHRRQLEELRVEPIDLVVGNLYPFQDAVSSGAPDHDVIEMIDIGGPTMVRAAAKNFAHVGVVVDPSDYGWVVEKLDQQDGLSWQDRRHLASKAFDHVAGYDAAIANWFHREDDFPTHVHVSLERRGDPLRYGENPHQSAAAYVDALDPHHGLGAARQLHGKEMSYNNYVDTDAALGMVADFAEPCVAIIKHTNPAGLALDDSLEQAYVKALAGDPVSAFGGIVAANRRIDGYTAMRIAEVFTEVVIAPGFDDDALEVLHREGQPAPAGRRRRRRPRRRAHPAVHRRDDARPGRRRRRRAVRRVARRVAGPAGRGHHGRAAVRVDGQQARQVQRHRAHERPCRRRRRGGPDESRRLGPHRRREVERPPPGGRAGLRRVLPVPRRSGRRHRRRDPGHRPARRVQARRRDRRRLRRGRHPAGHDGAPPLPPLKEPSMSDDDARDHRRVTLERLDTGVYRATNPRGITLDFGSKHEQGFSPVELLLAAIGGCSAIDVDMVTGRRSDFDHFEVVVEADKVRDDVGNILQDITLTFRVGFPDGEAGDKAREMLPRAARTSHDRTCTVSRTVESGTPVTVHIED